MLPLLAVETHTPTSFTLALYKWLKTGGGEGIAENKFVRFHNSPHFYTKYVKMRTIICRCSNLECNKDFEKPLNEYKRRIKLGKQLFCSRSCCGKVNIKNFGDKRNLIPPTLRYVANPFNYYIRNCRKREKDFNISRDYLQNIWDSQQGLCVYTKVPLILYNHSRRNKDIRYAASLDRIDNSKGYIEGNVQFISMAINYMKHTMSHEYLIEFLQIISTNIS